MGRVEKSCKNSAAVRQNRALAVWRQFRRNKGAMIGLVITAALILLAVSADFIWDYETDVIGMNIADRMISPGTKYLFGTDNYGRDMLARVGYGARYSLVIGAVSVLFGLFVGVQ